MNICGFHSLRRADEIHQAIGTALSLAAVARQAPGETANLSGMA